MFATAALHMRVLLLGVVALAAQAACLLGLASCACMYACMLDFIFPWHQHSCVWSCILPEQQPHPEGSPLPNPLLVLQAVLSAVSLCLLLALRVGWHTMLTGCLVELQRLFRTVHPGFSVSSSHGRERIRLAAAKATIVATHTHLHVVALLCSLPLHPTHDPHRGRCGCCCKSRVSGFVAGCWRHVSAREAAVGWSVGAASCVRLFVMLCRMGLQAFHIVFVQGFSQQAVPCALRWWRPCGAVCSGSLARGPAIAFKAWHAQSAGVWVPVFVPGIHSLVYDTSTSKSSASCRRPCLSAAAAGCVFSVLSRIRDACGVCGAIEDS